MNKRELVSGMLVATIITCNVAAPVTTVYASENSKEEVVYIMTDAAGSVNSVNVVNIFGKGQIKDYGDYSSVKMLNTTDEITQKGDEITFSTDSDKVYYQGTMENVEIPWNISIVYTLDGKNISPADLAGKSGKLNIHIKITQNGEADSEYFDNYALQAALSLDTELCKNIKADGATLANVGKNKQISYTVLPGKGLDAEITADVTDFEMDAVTVNGVKLNLNVEIDDKELMEKVTDIMNASKELNDGAGKVSDGANKLSDGGNEVNNGADTLYSGAASLDNGVNTLNNGILSIQSGLNTLNAKSGELTNGSEKMLSALKTVQSELNGVSMSTDDLKQLTESSAKIKKSIDELYKGAAELQNSLTFDAYNNTMKSNGLDIEKLQQGNESTIKTLNEQIETLQTAVNQLKQIPNYENIPDYASKVTELENQITSLSGIVTLLTGNNAAISGVEKYMEGVSEGTATLVKGLDELDKSYETFDKAIVTLADKLSELTVNLGTLKGGIDEIVSNYETLDSGIDNYTDGVAAIVAGYSNLVDGAGTLAYGSKNLVTGAGNLKQGTTELAKGIASLDSGATELSKGTLEFYNETSNMDTKVEDSIDEMVDSISGKGTDTVSFVSEKNGNVESVQFVIKGQAIKKQDKAEETKKETEKKSFWKKLAELF